MNAEKLKAQNSVLDSMQRSMETMAKEMKNGTIRQMQLAKRLKNEVKEQNPEVQGFEEEYQIVIEPQEEDEDKEEGKANLQGMPRRGSLIAMAQSSVYSGQTIDKIPDHK